MADANLVERMSPELELLLPLLDERARRLVLGAVARAAGEGGIGTVAGVTGASWQTVANGAAELASGDSAAPGRVRRPGAGRRKLADKDPGLVPALRALVEESTRGDPCSPLLWTTLSVQGIARELAGRGHRCGKNTVARLLAADGLSLQGNSRVIEGRGHPDRDAPSPGSLSRARLAPPPGRRARPSGAAPEASSAAPSETVASRTRRRASRSRTGSMT